MESLVDGRVKGIFPQANSAVVSVVALIVDAKGNPQQVHVVRPLGMGLDEKAVKAVR
jgi:hypothetical protein